MSFLILRVLALLITLLVFGSIGYRLSQRMKSPVSLATWIILVLFTLFVGTFTNLGILVGFFQFRIFASCALTALGVGAIIGLATREIRRRTGAGARV